MPPGEARYRLDGRHNITSRRGRTGSQKAPEKLTATLAVGTLAGRSNGLARLKGGLLTGVFHEANLVEVRQAVFPGCVDGCRRIAPGSTEYGGTNPGEIQ